MKVIRRISMLGLLVVAVLFVQGAGAATMTFLPESTHYQGRAYFREYTGQVGRIEFAVYDTLGTNGNEFAAAGYTAPGAGQYIYAYQIFNDDPDSRNVLEYFSVWGIGAGAIADPVVENIDWIDDTSGGEEPTAMYFAAFDSQVGPEKGIWEFEEGILDEGDHSFFLILSSDHNFYTPVDINYSVVKTTDYHVPIPNPEPSTIALLGIGGALALSRRRKSAT